jgi:hypothetical protein
MTEKVPIEHLLPNPFRNIGAYKIDEDKVHRLIASYRTTGYWPVIIARRAGKNGYYEQAYGHHRVEAFRRHYGKKAEIEVIVQNLSDDHMLQMMAHENQEDYKTSFVIQMENVHAVVKAYAEGKIKLQNPPPKTSKTLVRYASSPGTDHPYTAETVAKYLGWLNPDGSAPAKVRDSLRALELVEQGVATIDQFIGFGIKHATEMLIAIGKIRSKDEANIAFQEKRIADAEKEIRESRKLLADANAKGKEDAALTLRTAKDEKEHAKWRKLESERKIVRNTKKVVDKVTEGVRQGEGKRAVQRIAQEAVLEDLPKRERKEKEIRDVLWDVMGKIDGILRPASEDIVDKALKKHADPLRLKLEEIIENLVYLDDENIKQASDTLEALSIRATCC